MTVDPPIQTSRLLLREFVQDDFRSIHEYARDPEVVKFQPWGPNSLEDTEDFLQRTILAQADHPRYDFEFAIVTSDSGALIGGCGLTITNVNQCEGSIGYCLNRNAWGRGYATEAAMALLKFAFEHLKLHRVWATCDPENLGSIRVLEKCGMRREGYLVEHLRIHGHWRDSLLWAILAYEMGTARRRQ